MPGRMNNNASYSSAPDAALADAASALRNNDIARAEALVRTCLSADPENVEALRLLAGVAASTGYSTDAEKLLRRAVERSEEHTSELQSLMRISYAVFCLKKKKIN